MLLQWYRDKVGEADYRGRLQAGYRLQRQVTVTKLERQVSPQASPLLQCQLLQCLLHGHSRLTILLQSASPHVLSVLRCWCRIVLPGLFHALLCRGA